MAEAGYKTAGKNFEALGAGIKELAGDMWASGGIKSAFTDIKANRGAHLSRAAGGAMAGALGGMGIHAATGVLGLPTTALGLTSNDMSFGGLMGSAFRGAMVGGALGAGAVSGTTGSLRGWASSSAEAFGTLAPKTAGKIVGKLDTSGGLNSLGGQIGYTLETGISRAGSSLFSNVKSAGMTAFGEGPIASRLASGMAMSGLGHAAFSSNALGMAVPSNYGYR